MFLSEQELRELTGYAYASKQIEWLRRNNWKFEVTAHQRHKVARGYFDVRMGAANPKQTQELAPSLNRPNFQALVA